MLYNHVPLDFPAGTKYAYSNEGYQVLWYVIERVLGQSYASFIGQHILSPLHMNESGFDLPAGKSIARGTRHGRPRQPLSTRDLCLRI